jgi:hypothetical protein
LCRGREDLKILYHLDVTILKLIKLPFSKKVAFGLNRPPKSSYKSNRIEHPSSVWIELFCYRLHTEIGLFASRKAEYGQVGRSIHWTIPPFSPTCTQPAHVIAGTCIHLTNCYSKFKFEIFVSKHTFKMPRGIHNLGDKNMHR